MQFYKIKIFLFLFFVFSSFPTFAQVQVEELPDNILDAYGLEKTLPFTSWGDIPFDILTEVTEDLAKQKKSAVLANLTAAVLIQPTFIQATGWTKKQSQEWLVLRLKSLIDLGHADKALSMMEKLPSSVVSTEVLKLQMDAYFLQENWKKACSVALQNTQKDKYFTHVQMLCLGLAGEKDKALLAFDLWQEEYPDEKIVSFVMGQLMDIPIEEPDVKENLTIADTFVLKQLKSASLNRDVLPLAYQKLEGKTYTGFGSAVNVQKLFQIWQNAGLNEKQQTYRFYLLTVYADLFLPSLRFIRQDFLWNKLPLDENFSLRTLFLKDKPESQITGADLLLGLWLLKNESMDIKNALILLSKGGLHLENYILEQLNP